MALRILMLRLVLSIGLFCSAETSMAQNGWHYLPNVGLAGPTTRFEDVYFTDTNTGYAVFIPSVFASSGQKQIYKTMDGGNNWRCVGPSIYGSDGLRSIEFLDDKVTGIVGSLHGTVYRTTDSGATWADITTSLEDTVTTDTFMVGTRNICGLAHYGNYFYGVGWWGSGRGRVYKSTDKGVTWNTIYIDTTLATGLVDAVFVSSDTGFVTGGRNQSPGNYTSSSDESMIIRTCDGGATWQKVFSDTTLGGRIWKIQVIDRQHLVGSIEPYYYPDSVNMIKSDDGGSTWSIIHVGSTHDSVVTYGCITQGVGFVNRQMGWLGGYYTGLFQTLDGGATWDTLQFGTTFNRMFVVDPQHVYAGGLMVYKWSPWPGMQVPHHETVREPHKLYPINPNPASGIVHIDFDLLCGANVVLQVVNVDQRKHVPIVTAAMKPGHYSYQWDATGMPPGNYLVWLGTDQTPLVRRFVVVK